MNNVSEFKVNELLRELRINVIDQYDHRIDPLTKKHNLIVKTDQSSELNLELKRLHDLRYTNFLPQLLESYYYSKNILMQGSDFLLIIKTTKASKAILAKARKYLQEFSASELNWIVADEAGQLFGHYNNKEIHVEVLSNTISSKKDIIMGAVNESVSISYSAIQQWLLKFLILNGINSKEISNSKKLWPLEYNTNLSNYRVLSEVSGVSESSCFTFLKLLERAGYLERSNLGYRLKNLRNLLDGWFHAFANEKKEVLYLSPIKPLYDEKSWARDAIERFYEYCNSYNSKIIISGHLGTKACSLSFSNNDSSIFYTPSVSTNDFHLFMKNMQLTPYGDSSSSIRAIVQKKKYPVIALHDICEDEKAIVSDPIQLFLDVQYIGSRGHEQAQFIYEKILIKHFENMKWLS